MVWLQIASILALFLICNAGIAHHRCGDNAEYLDSASICRPYCDQIPKELEQIHCKLSFLPGCYCLPGHTRPFIDSIHCVPVEDCDRLPKCRVNETYKECANLFPRDCGDLSPRVFIGKCHAGCDCREGYVRIFNSDESNCVLESECGMYVNKRFVRDIFD